MTRQLTVPAALTVTPGADLWLVGEGESTVPYWPDGRSVQTLPPAEFVAAAAPCEPVVPWRGRLHAGCNYLPGHFPGGALYCNKCGFAAPCPVCRVELVGECQTDAITCHCGCDGPCPDCGRAGDQFVDLGTAGITTLGWGYAIGQPLPIRWYSGDPDTEPNDAAILVRRHADGYHYADLWSASGYEATITDRLAHYGDPAGLVGKWALQVQVST